jgi:ribokinase
LEDEMAGRIVILGVFVADAAFRATRLPRMGETVLGDSFALGPGGKGSNQAVAAARAGASVSFLTRLGADLFADMAQEIWRESGVSPRIVSDPDSRTGAAFIFVDDATGDNAIIVAPGAAARLSAADVEGWAAEIAAADVFVTQLEQPADAALRGLEIAREAGVTTVLNPAPAAPLPEGMLALCDYVIPNESEAEALTGVRVGAPEDAERAARILLAGGAGAAIVTLGAGGALFCDGARVAHAPAIRVGPTVETTGAGDAFVGAFAAALAEGADPLAAVRFGCAAAGISVTRPGTALASPSRAEIDAIAP